MNLNIFWRNLDKTKLWHYAVVMLVLFTSVVVTLYVDGTQDEDMRQSLMRYSRTIERSIDWEEFAGTLNNDPSKINPADLDRLKLRLNEACKANPDCHFIYLMYVDRHPQGEQIKFLLDASPQPTSEISRMGDVYTESTEAFKMAMRTKSAIVEGPVRDHWGTWVSASVPVEITKNTPHFVMLGIDVASSVWSGYIVRKVVVPITVALIFLFTVLGFIYQGRLRESLLKQLYKATSDLSTMANSDGLTGLPNRRLLEDRIEQAIKEAKRAQHTVALLFLDLDAFKVVNDSHGHAVGDLLLKSVAERLQELMRAEDTIARIGGDEFIVLLPRQDNKAEVTMVTERIIEAINKPFSINELVLHIGVSVGVALYPDHDNDPHALLKYADSAMYFAKQHGRNRYAIYNSDTMKETV